LQKSNAPVLFYRRARCFNARYGFLTLLCSAEKFFAPVVYNALTQAQFAILHGLDIANPSETRMMVTGARGFESSGFCKFMQSNITNEQFSSSSASLSEPHFDDEATVLSARPVVPIEELTKKVGFSRPWAFGLAVAGALLLGVAATAFYYSLFSTLEGRPFANLATVSSNVQGVAPEPPKLNELPGATGITKSDASSVDSNKSAKAKMQAASRPVITRPLHFPKDRVKVLAPRRETPVVDQRVDYENETREQRRAARRDAQERKREIRERRAARRSDEVLRIREIFEGPARP
jgi:hypothetical protein